MEWYYAAEQEPVGPVSEEEFQSLVNDGTIQPDTLVWNETLPDWKKYNQLAPSAEGGEPPVDERVFCAECGRPFPPDELVAFDNARVCAACKPVFLQKIKEGVTISGNMRYAGFWIRAGATIIDYIILWVVQIIMMIPFTMLMTGMMGDLNAANEPDFQNMAPVLALQFLMMFLQFAVYIGYETWFIGKYAATPGKMACRIKVVKADGEPVGYGLAFGRYFAKIISGIILGIGYIMAGFDSQKRALHDHICNTRVIHKD